MATYLPDKLYHRTAEEELELLVHSIKANKVCRTERKAFNLCRATLLGKLVEPQHCSEKAISLIDCFQTVRQDANPAAKTAFQRTLECAKRLKEGGAFSFGSCSKELDEYLAL
eukprot:TRINITY_DN67_c0_g1_i1.p1 TRINITY_DN67_c0_g1~~TRINITY_DN67_c0_g1_i1.p1  ORF type:complete len:113 (+),score=37.24 TRINITY_DN67_c0_g1_i1:133-471(+)